MPSQQKTPIESDESKLLLLPDEIKLEVFKNLSPQHLLAVSATCHELHHLIKDPSLWTELTVDISESRRSLIWKVEKCPKLEILRVSNKTGLRVSKVDRNKITNLIRRSPNLKIIEWMNECLMNVTCFKELITDIDSFGLIISQQVSKKRLKLKVISPLLVKYKV